MRPMEGAIMEQRFRDVFFRTLVLSSMYSELRCGLEVEDKALDSSEQTTSQRWMPDIPSVKEALLTGSAFSKCAFTGSSRTMV